MESLYNYGTLFLFGLSRQTSWSKKGSKGSDLAEKLIGNIRKDIGFKLKFWYLINENFCSKTRNSKT